MEFIMTMMITYCKPHSLFHSFCFFFRDISLACSMFPYFLILLLFILTYSLLPLVFPQCSMTVSLQYFIYFGEL